MLKVYGYCLSTVLVIDTEERSIFIAHLHELKDQDRAFTKSKVTRATINKHLRSGCYVASDYILSNFADEEETRNRHTRLAAAKFFGEFKSYEELSVFVKSLYDKTAAVKDKYHFVNFASDLIDVVIALRQGKTEQEFNQHNNRYEEELALYKALAS